jgi:hypothetical protein
MEISRSGPQDGRRSLVGFSTELQKLHFQTRPKIRPETDLFP